jgi:ABC-2 type transport system ATP-binding protein
LIEVRNLTRNYGEFVAVQDVSFSIPQGQIVGLLGHNGAGKTTIMKVLTGFLEPTEGSFSIAGLDFAENRLLVQEKIGYLPEHSSLYPDMTVMQYLEYACKLRAIPEDSIGAAINSAIDRTELRDYALEKIDTLSKGYRQRLGVAQAIVHNPEILIMDEATSGLDPSQIEGMRRLFRELSKDATIILSTHIMQEVEAVCDRVIIISQGRLVADASLDDLRASDRLVVVLNRAYDEVSPVFSGVAGVKSVECLDSQGSRSEFLLTLNKEVGEISPQIASLVVEKNWELYHLGQEQRSLETIFREINTEVAGGSDVE